MFSKVATWIMVILLCVGTLGYSLILNLDRVIESFYDPSQYWQDQLDYARQYANEVDAYGRPTDYALSCKVDVIAYSYLIDNNLSGDDWRYTTGLIENMADAKVYGPDDLAARLQRIADNKDMKAYYEWKFEREMESYPERESIYRWALNYLVDHEIEPGNADWRESMVRDVMTAKITILEQERFKREESVEYSEEKYQAAKDAEVLGLYQLEHNQKNNPADSFGNNLLEMLFDYDNGSGFWNAMVNSVNLVYLVGILCVVFGGIIVATEFSAGTIKFLLINPAKRWKILMSKYVTVLLCGLAATFIVFFFSFLMALLVNGGADAFRPALAVKNGVVVKTSPYLKLIGLYLLSEVKVLLMMTFAFAMSSLTHSSALSIGVSLSAFFGGNILIEVMKLMKLDFARYFIFANWDFAAIVNKTSGFVHHSLPLAIVIVVLHMVVFLWTAWDGFVRREV